MSRLTGASPVTYRRVACAGDSRCVLGSRVDGEVVALDLSRDHTPDLVDERKRHEKAGGVVTEAGPEGKPPSRVFTRGPNAHGVAMSRSIGDLTMRKVGVIPEPEVKQYTLKPAGTGGDAAKTDLFLIVASDGVWEFITSTEACKLVAKFDDVAKACEALVHDARQRWELHEKGLYQDDITAVVVRLPLLESALAA